MSPVRNCLALIACAFLLGCAPPKRFLVTSADPRVVDVPDDSLDRVRVSWGSRGGMVVSTITRISPSDWVRKESIRVHKAEDMITVCYSITRRPGMPRGIPPLPTKLIFIVDGVDRYDRRPVRLSISCGKNA